jgi:cbb3-type cytochrome oxidase subunit 3
VIELLHSVMTVAAFSAFLGIVWWAYAPSRKSLWERRAVLDEEER